MTMESGSGETGEPAAAGQGDSEGTPEAGNTVLAGNQGTEQTGSHDQGVQSDGNPILDQITDQDIKADPSLQNVTSIEDLAKSYVHAQKLVGKDRIPLPSSEDDHTAWNDVLSKLGRPESADQYELPQPAEDSRVEVKDDMQSAFKQKAHELGLTNKQARDLWGWYVSDVAEGELQRLDQQHTEMRQNAEKELRKEFGNAFDDRIQDAQRAISELGGDDVMQKIDASGLGNDPDIIRFLAKVGEGMREDTVGGSSRPLGRTPDQAKQEINRLKSDQQFMQVYMDHTATGHQEAVQRMSTLYKDAYPDQ